MHKRGLSALLSVVMTMSILPALPASALENDEPFPYTLFAGSEEDGAITINADNVCLNGSIVTNGSIETTATNFNVNGQRIEHAQQSMVYAFGKLDDAYFDSDTVLTYESDYTVEDVNISLNTPIVSTGNISLNGNINLNTQLKAEEDILVSGDSCNANNAALISHHGDIYIESTNFGFAGLIYAPYGDIVIDSSSLNLNNVVVIGQTITIDAPNLNVNHNPSAANVIGTISEDPDDHHDDADNYFYAVGAYNAETSMIDIAWSGSDVPATVDVLTSIDGETYSVVAAVTDATTYAYPVGNDFVSTYFKVSYTDTNGNAIESIPFQAIVTEDGITIDYPDSDDDGIADILESILGTDPYLIDTDDDGLTDYQELNITGTDPTDYDSVEDNISDADADTDDDGVSNLDEIELETDPQIQDTDDDGLTDGEEVNTYLTDPLLEDTDGDGLNDGFEVRYGLDPLSPYTNGIADAGHKIEQTISSDSPVLSEVNTSDSPYEMSVTITTNGDAERGLAVTESGYSVSLENDAQIGGITDLNLSDSCDPDSIRLTYAIKDAYRSNTLNKYSEFEDLQGIKRLCVFKYFDEISMMLPLDTQYDLENNTIYADVNDGGTYCVMDLEVWFDLFDLELDEIQIPVEVSEPQSNPPRQYLPRASADPVNKAPLDLVFILQTAGPVHMGNIYSDELSLMEEVSEFALTQYTDVRIYVIDYKYDSANIIKFGPRDYCTNVSALTNKIRNLEYTALNINDYCDTRIPFNLLKTELKLRKGVNSYIYHLHNGSNRFWTPTEDGISICNSDLGIFSQIVQVNTVYSSEEYKQALAAAIQENHGLNIEYDETTVSEIINHIRNNIDLSKTRTEYDALIATSLTKITLDDKLSPNNDVDTDEDTIYDWDEADNRYITVNTDGSVSLPTIQDLLSHINIADVFNIPETAGYARNAMFNAIRNREVLPCKTDPTLKDSDGDDVNDDEDEYPLIALTGDALEIYEFFQTADDFEIAYLFGGVRGENRGFVSSLPRVVDRVRLIKVMREHAFSTDREAFYRDLQPYGFVNEIEYYPIVHWVKPIRAYDLALGSYELAYYGTSYAELSAYAYQEWTASIKLIASIWLFGVSEQYCNTLASYNYSTDYSISLESERKLATYIEQQTNPKEIPFSSEADDHLFRVQRFDKDRQGLVGGHSLDGIYEYSRTTRQIEIIEKVPGNVDGIYEISYKAKKLDGSGEWLAKTYTKTVYDPSIISDSAMMQYAREALSTADIEIINQRLHVTGVASNGLWFEGWFNNLSEINAYYPIVRAE